MACASRSPPNRRWHTLTVPLLVTLPCEWMIRDPSSFIQLSNSLSSQNSSRTPSPCAPPPIVWQYWCVA
eukprot:3138-Eustigmatos_ZCMA.PRE.1